MCVCVCGFQNLRGLRWFRASCSPDRRNIANLVNNTDTSAMSVIQYAVGILKARLLSGLSVAGLGNPVKLVVVAWASA